MKETSAVEIESNCRVVLSDSERDDLAAIARELTQTPPALLDNDKWRAVAYELAAGVPLRIRRELRRFRRDPGPDGVLLLSNLWLDPERLPDTPAWPDSVEREATLPAATQTLIGLYLGEMVAYQNEKDGALVQNVVPVRGQERAQSNAGSAVLEMHVENAFHPYRPEFVVLMCLRNDHENRAVLLTGSVRRAFPHLPAEVRQVLREERFTTHAPPSFVASNARKPRHAVFTGALDDPDITVDFNATEPLDDEARHAMDVLKTHLAAVARTFVLRPGDLAVVDNRVTVHGRSEFTARYDGRDRWLHRSFIHLDNRRSLGARVGDSQVIA